MYQALYRKWRPKTFDEVVGQEHITETLKSQMQSGRLSHAYLFVGTRGTGKTTCAKILAKAVNCENPVNGNPCNCCRTCLGIDDGSITDVVEMDAASNNGVDNVRALRDEAIFSPAETKKRVYIIDEVHMLSTSAFNALLKILEEPPEHLLFILATTELNKVLPTILSRCQRYSFRRLSPEVIFPRLRYVASQEQLSATDDALRLIARMADGGMRDALSLLDQCAAETNIDVASVQERLGICGSAETLALLTDITHNNTAGALARFESVWSLGKSPSSVLDELSTLMRDIILTRVARGAATGLLSGLYSEEDMAAFSAVTTEKLMQNCSNIHNCLADMKNGQEKGRCEICLIRMTNPSSDRDIGAVLSRIDELERKVSALSNGRPVAIPTQPIHAAPAQDSPKAQSAQPVVRSKPVADKKPPFADNPHNYNRPPVEETPPDYNRPPVEEAPPDYNRPPVEETPPDYNRPPVEETPPDYNRPPFDEDALDYGRPPLEEATLNFRSQFNDNMPIAEPRHVEMVQLERPVRREPAKTEPARPFTGAEPATETGNRYPPASAEEEQLYKTILKRCEEGNFPGGKPISRGLVPMLERNDVYPVFTDGQLLLRIPDTPMKRNMLENRPWISDFATCASIEMEEKIRIVLEFYDPNAPVPEQTPESGEPAEDKLDALRKFGSVFSFDS